MTGNSYTNIQIVKAVQSFDETYFEEKSDAQDYISNLAFIIAEKGLDKIKDPNTLEVINIIKDTLRKQGVLEVLLDNAVLDFVGSGSHFKTYFLKPDDMQEIIMHQEPEIVIDSQTPEGNAIDTAIYEVPDFNLGGITELASIDANGNFIAGEEWAKENLSPEEIENLISTAKEHGGLDITNTGGMNPNEIAATKINGEAILINTNDNKQVNLDGQIIGHNRVPIELVIATVSIQDLVQMSPEEIAKLSPEQVTDILILDFSVQEGVTIEQRNALQEVKRQGFEKNRENGMYYGINTDTLVNYGKHAALFEINGSTVSGNVSFAAETYGYEQISAQFEDNYTASKQKFTPDVNRGIYDPIKLG